MYENLETTTCRLIREDGDIWAVRKLELAARPPEARAVPLSSGEDGTGEARNLRLVRGDRLEWLQEDGTMVWATRIPVTAEPPSGPPRATREIDEQTGAA